MSKIERVASFVGNYRFLSNFYGGEDDPLDFTRCPIMVNGLLYCCVEVPYQSFKTTSLVQRAEMKTWSARRAKSWSHGIVKRPDWNLIKLAEIMPRLISIKFRTNTKLGDMLLATGEAELIEGNWWCDNFWGACICTKCKDVVKHNHLGLLLMKRRKELS